MRVWTALVVIVCLAGCGKSDEKKQSPECKSAMDVAHQTWGVYVKALEKEQPRVERKSAKFAPEEGYEDDKAAAKEAIRVWEKATVDAIAAAKRARFGERGSDRLEPTRAALEAAEAAREKAEEAIDRAFAARYRKGEDEIQSARDAANPAKGRLSLARKKKLEEKLLATQERITKNNGIVDKAKQKLSEQADALLELAKQAADADQAVVVACPR